MFVYEPEKCTEVVELNLTDEEFLSIARAAHALDVTINHYINLAIYTALQRSEEEEPSA